MGASKEELSFTEFKNEVKAKKVKHNETMITENITHLRMLLI